MNRNFDYTEQIENYLEGNMSEKEMKDFDSNLQNDPTMKSEFQLQKDIINSLKASRKAELKARLDNINVGSYGSSLTGLKIALTVALTAAIGLSIYFFSQEKSLENEKNKLTKQETTIQQINKEDVEVQTPSQNYLPAKDETSSEAIEMPTASKPLVENNNRIKTPSVKADATEPEATTVEPRANTAEVVLPKTAEDFETTEETNTEAEVPENGFSTNSVSEELTAVEVESKEDATHTFHYKFYNNKLYLYGDFKNIPYEIIELNTVSGKSLYLYYQDHFYYLESNQIDVSPLKEIRDQKLIEDLDSLRVKK